MIVLGIVGGVASGKSLVADELRKLGAEVLDGDRAGHAVLEQPEVREAILDRWGAAVFSSAEAGRSGAANADPSNQALAADTLGAGTLGPVDRKAIARIVFDPSPAGRSELEFLEQLTHPRIGTLLQSQAAALAGRGVPVAVLDAPVMIKAGWAKFCDRILFVDVPREVRRQRAMARGWSGEEFARREAAQESLEVKQSYADAVIDNSGSPAHTRQQVERFWREAVGPV